MTRDRLTGLPDRQAFLGMAAERMTIGVPEAGITLVLIDLHRLSTVNHAFGFAAGDAALRETAGHLAVAAGGAFVARLGSDEFGVLVEEDEPALAGEIAAAIQAEAGPAAAGTDASLATSPLVTIGIASARCGEGVDVLLQRAETALHAARRQGGACIETFRPEFHGGILERRHLERELFGAGARGELRLHYQPVVDLGTRGVIGLEALVRWERPGHGLVPPGSFIDAAEECGAIVGMGEWVLERACRQAREWNQRLRLRPPVVISVNVSACQLRARRFVDSVAEILDTVGIEPNLVNLEVTESALMADTDAMIRVLGRLKDLGVLLALDDFGTGYSSLSYVRRLPVDFVKIDRAFVSGVASDSEEWALAVAIVKLATSLGRRTLAEGIETGAQLAHLRSLGCDLGQGFLFSPPLDAGDTCDFLSSSSPRAPARQA